jgi:hypothetical protein
MSAYNAAEAHHHSSQSVRPSSKPTTISTINSVEIMAMSEALYV